MSTVWRLRRFPPPSLPRPNSQTVCSGSLSLSLESGREGPVHHFYQSIKLKLYVKTIPLDFQFRFPILLLRLLAYSVEFAIRPFPAHATTHRRNRRIATNPLSLPPAANRQLLLFLSFVSRVSQATLCYERKVN